jgi:hypothetical protein
MLFPIRRDLSSVNHSLISAGNSGGSKFDLQCSHFVLIWGWNISGTKAAIAAPPLFVK